MTTIGVRLTEDMIKTFAEILTEQTEEEIRSNMNLDPEEYVLYHNGKWVIDTKHAISRMSQRGDTKNINKFLRNIIDYFIKNNSKSQEYLIISKSSKLGIALDWRKDKKGRVKGNNLIVLSWFGNVEDKLGKTPSQVFAKEGTKKILIERLDLQETICYIEFD